MSPVTKDMLLGICIAIWLINLYLFKKAKNQAAVMVFGMIGTFILTMVLIRPILTEPMARLVAAFTGLIGDLSGAYTAYLKYGMLFIPTPDGSMTLKVDFECSGIIEIMIYLSILYFYKIYSIAERAVMSIVGVVYIILSNVIRVTVIAFMIHQGGEQVYYVAHTYIGRLVFYALTIVLYFYVFTRPQVTRMKVGSFSYDKKKEKDQ